MDARDIEHYQELERRKRLARLRRRRDEEWRQQREARQKAEAEKTRTSEVDGLLIGTALALAEDIERVKERVKAYEAATVAALIKNEEKLASARARLAVILENAFVLPDGRRVFRTADGRDVFDEHGNAVAADDIDPSAIPDHHPNWETYKAESEQIERLEHERQELLDFQEQLDEARDRLDDGDLTQDELDDLEEKLESRMPSAVRGELGELGLDADTRSDFEASRSRREDTAEPEETRTDNAVVPLRGPSGGP